MAFRGAKWECRREYGFLAHRSPHGPRARCLGDVNNIHILRCRPDVGLSAFCRI